MGLVHLTRWSQKDSSGELMIVSGDLDRWGFSANIGAERRPYNDIINCKKNLSVLPSVILNGEL